eukprot:6200555-Pleurochrysis_carterae.AAC.1
MAAQHASRRMDSRVLVARLYTEAEQAVHAISRCSIGDRHRGRSEPDALPLLQGGIAALLVTTDADGARADSILNKRAMYVLSSYVSSIHLRSSILKCNRDLDWVGMTSIFIVRLWLERWCCHQDDKLYRSPHSRRRGMVKWL